MSPLLPSEIIFASGNKGKTSEVRKVLAAFGITLWSCHDFARERKLGPPPAVDEVGTTYRENATLKAQAYVEWSGLPSLGDDSGLEVEALGGAPGLFSARYAGVGATDDDNNRKLIQALDHIQKEPPADKWAARYVSHVMLLFPDGSKYEADGVLEGQVTRVARGKGGFGYDPLFVVKGSGNTLAELKQQGVPVDTHRIQAVRKLCACLASNAEFVQSPRKA